MHFSLYCFELINYIVEQLSIYIFSLVDEKHRWIYFSHFLDLVSTSKILFVAPTAFFCSRKLAQHIFRCYIFLWKISLILNFFHCKNICSTLFTDTVKTTSGEYNILAVCNTHCWNYSPLRAILKSNEFFLLALMNEPHSFWHLWTFHVQYS